MAAPGMATGNPANGHPATFKKAIFLERFDSIRRTAGRKPAFRTQPGRNNQLINPDQKNQRITKYSEDAFHV